MTLKIRVGPAGWSYPDWKGVVYPPSPGSKFEPLTYLSAYFDLIEVNVTFYRSLSPRITAAWIKKIAGNQDFRFSVKLFRKFTHETDTLAAGEEKLWKAGIEPLLEAGRLGALLAQFPYSFHYGEDAREYLYRLQRSFDGYPLVVEVRHRSWDRKEVVHFFKDLGVGFCNIDQPQVSYSFPASSLVTSPIAYLRLHGRNVRDWFRKSAGRDDRYNYLYLEPELQEWVNRIHRISSSAQEAYVVTNNHYRGQAVCNALQLKSMLEGCRVPIPDSLLPFYPQLSNINKRKK